MAAFLVDTNVLAYAYDAGEAARASRARACIRRLGDSRNGVVSAQILGEFFVVATRRLRPPLSAVDAEQVAVNLSRSWTVLNMTAAAALEAMRAARQYQFPYFDGLIWATAKLNGVPNVLTGGSAWWKPPRRRPLRGSVRCGFRSHSSGLIVGSGDSL